MNKKPIPWNNNFIRPWKIGFSRLQRVFSWLQRPKGSRPELRANFAPAC
jgi:hypothetical protein